MCCEIGLAHVPPVRGLLTNLDITVRVQQNIRASERLVFETFQCEVGHASHDLL
jgi:hypothetical protein